jgi:hypothetical protein
MNQVRMLFVGEYPALSEYVTRALNSLRCEFQYAPSREQSLAAMEEQAFRVVLSKSKLADGNARTLIPAVQKVSGWLFLSVPVEDGCWWIPVVQEGRLCFEAAALHSREFSKALVKIVKTMMAGASRGSAAERSIAPKSLVCGRLVNDPAKEKVASEEANRKGNRYANASS